MCRGSMPTAIRNAAGSGVRIAGMQQKFHFDRRSYIERLINHSQ